LNHLQIKVAEIIIQTMIIPFSVQYSKRINAKVAFDDFDGIIANIAETIETKSGEEIMMDKDQLTYKSKILTFRWDFNILKPIDKGIFNLEFRESECYLLYEFFMYRMLFISFISAVICLIVEVDILIAAAILFGLNWIITIIRHRLLFNEIVSDVEDSVNKKNDRLTRAKIN